MVENTAQKERKGGKFEESFKGTYTIEESIGKGLYKLKNQHGKILQKKINISRLKVHKTRDMVEPVHDLKQKQKVS